MKRIISLFILCGIVLLGVCGCDDKKLTNETNKNIDTKEDLNIKENDTDIKDNDTKEDTNLDNKEETKPTISSNNSTTSDEKQETTTKQENITNNEDTIINNSGNKEESIIGTWIYNNGTHVYIFEDSKLIIISTSMNSIKENNYRIEENRIIINETNNTEYEIKGDTLYLGTFVLKKADSNYVYPSIYYNYDTFYGTWKLESEIKTITL